MDMNGHNIIDLDDKTRWLSFINHVTRSHKMAD